VVGCFVGNIQIHPGASSLMYDPSTNSSARRFLDPLLASSSGAGSSNPGLFANSFGPDLSLRFLLLGFCCCLQFLVLLYACI
jgi:hypothetical protein